MLKKTALPEKKSFLSKTRFLKKTKKIISVLLTVVMVLGMLPGLPAPVRALAADGEGYRIGYLVYETFAQALAAAQNGDRIEVLQDTILNSTVIVDGKSIEIYIPSQITFAINNMALTGVSEGGTGLLVRNNGSLKITRNQSFPGAGVFSLNANTGAKAESGGKIELVDDVYGIQYAAWADGAGSQITVTGAYARLTQENADNASSRTGVYASNGGVVKVSGGVEGHDNGVVARSGGSVEVSGEVRTSPEKNALLSEQAGGAIKVTGHVKGNGLVTADGAAAVITVEGDIEGRVHAKNGGKVNVNKITREGISSNGDLTYTPDVTAPNKEFAVVTAEGAATVVNIEGTVGWSSAGATTPAAITGVKATGGAKATVGGDVIATIVGVEAEGKDTAVSVTGDVKAQANKLSGAAAAADYGVKAAKGAMVTVLGNVLAHTWGAAATGQEAADPVTIIKILGNLETGNKEAGAGVSNSDGFVLVDGLITASSTYVNIPALTKTIPGTPQTEINTPEKKLTQAEFEGLPKVVTIPEQVGSTEGYIWYYYNGENTAAAGNSGTGGTNMVTHSFTLVKGEAPGACAIGGTRYQTVEQAAAAVKNEETIRLLQDIQAGGLAFTNGMNFTIDLRGYNLTANNPDGPGVLVTDNTVVKLISGGQSEFNAVGSTAGVEAQSGGNVTVSNATATAGNGAYIGANDSGKIYVLKNATGEEDGAAAMGPGFISVGSSEFPGKATGNKNTGAKAQEGGQVVVYGDAVGLVFGAAADGIYAHVIVNGNTIGTGDGSTGAFAKDYGFVEVFGDAVGVACGVRVEGFLNSYINFNNEGEVLVAGKAKATGAGGIGVNMLLGLVTVNNGIEAEVFFKAFFPPNDYEDPLLPCIFSADDNKDFPDESRLLMEFEDPYDYSVGDWVRDDEGYYSEHKCYYYEHFKIMPVEGLLGVFRRCVDPNGNDIFKDRHSFLFVKETANPDPVCEVSLGGTFEDAGKALQKVNQLAQTGNITDITVKLSKDMYCDEDLILFDKKLKIETNGHNLTFGRLYMDNSTLTVSGDGEVRANGGVSMYNKSTATLTGAKTPDFMEDPRAAAYVTGGSKLVLKEDAVGALQGVWASGKDTVVSVRDAIGNGVNCYGAVAIDNALVTVTRNAEGNFGGGAYAESGGVVNVAGNAVAQADCGAYAYDKGKVTVSGNATGPCGAGASLGGTVAVTGDAIGREIGADAYDGGIITVSGSAIGDNLGALADGRNSSVTVNFMAIGTAAGSTGAVAKNGGKATVKTGAQGQLIGAAADGAIFNLENGAIIPSTVSIADGGAIATAPGSCGAQAVSGGSVTITNGNAEGAAAGAAAFDEGSKVKVGKNAIASNGTGAVATTMGQVTVSGNCTGAMRGAEAIDGGTITVTGDCGGKDQGAYATGSHKPSGAPAAYSKINIGGAVSASDQAKGYGVISDAGAEISVSRIIGGHIGAVAQIGGKVTVFGEISESCTQYVGLAKSNTVYLKSKNEFTYPTTKAGYLTYSDGVSTVWVSGTDTGPGAGGGGAAAGGDWLPNATKNNFYSVHPDPETGLTQVIGRKTLSWTAAGLPSGLAIDPETGVIKGLPRVSGDYSFSVTSENDAGVKRTVGRKLTILPDEGGIVISGGVIGDARVYMPYDGSLSVSFGTMPYRACFVGLPDGVSFGFSRMGDAHDINFTGWPRQVGIYNVDYWVEDGGQGGTVYSNMCVIVRQYNGGAGAAANEYNLLFDQNYLHWESNWWANQSYDALTEDLNLITRGPNGSEITWESDNPAVSPDGTVTRPSSDGWDAKCVLTYTITLNDDSRTGSYLVTVLKKPNPETDPACEIDGVRYASFTDALDAIGEGESKTIILSKTNYLTKGLTVSGKSVTIDLNGFDLLIDTRTRYDYMSADMRTRYNNDTFTTALYVYDDGNIYLEGEGEFNVRGGLYGVRISGCDVTVSNIFSNICGAEVAGPTSRLNVLGSITHCDDWKGTVLGSDGNPGMDYAAKTLGYGVIIESGARVSVGGDLSGFPVMSAIVSGDGSELDVARNVRATMQISGAKAAVGGNSANIVAAEGALAGVSGHSGVIFAYSDAQVSVSGYSGRIEASDAGTVVTVGSAAGSVYAKDASVFILGDCEVFEGHSRGVIADGGEVIIDGKLISRDGYKGVSGYITVSGEPKNRDQRTVPTTKEGYATYTNSLGLPGTVWVKEEAPLFRIGDEIYNTWEEALDAVPNDYDGKAAATAVTLLRDVFRTAPVHIRNKNILLDLNGYDFNIDTRNRTPSGTDGALVQSGWSRVNLTGEGEFNVRANGCAISYMPESYYCELTVDNVESQPYNNKYYDWAVNGFLGYGSITVRGSVVAESGRGVMANGRDLTVYGDIVAQTEGLSCGAAGFAYTPSYTVNVYGDVVVTGDSQYEDRVAAVTVSGSPDKHAVNIMGDVRAYKKAGAEEQECLGVLIPDGLLSVGGDIVSDGTGVIANAWHDGRTWIANTDSSKVMLTAGGSVTASGEPWMMFGVTEKGKGDFEAVSAKPGYAEYTDGGKSVWVWVGSGVFVPVGDISGLPGQAAAGTPLVLGGTVQPANTSRREIVWSVKDPGTTGAVIADGVLNSAAMGTVTVTATVKRGLGVADFNKDFVITLNSGPAFVPLSGLSGVAAAAVTGVPLELSATFSPEGATNKAIVWSVKDTGKTLASIIDGNALFAVYPGTVTVTATVPHGGAAGADFSRDFIITVTDNQQYVCEIPGVGKFTAFDHAMGTVKSGQTIRLLADIQQKKPLWVIGKTINLDLGDYNLDLDVRGRNYAFAMEVYNGGKLFLTGTGAGQLNITTDDSGLLIYGSGSEVTVNNIKAAISGIDFGDAASKITVNGDIEVKQAGGGGYGIKDAFFWESNEASPLEIVVNGSITADLSCVYINVPHAKSLTVSGDLLCTGVRLPGFMTSHGQAMTTVVDTEIGGNVKSSVTGIEIYDAKVRIGGNVDASYRTISGGGMDVWVGGDVTSDSYTYSGVSAASGTLQIEGRMRLSGDQYYLHLGNKYYWPNELPEIPTTKENYVTYFNAYTDMNGVDRSATIWVGNPVNYPVTDIINLPNRAIVSVPLTLSGLILPYNATNRDNGITWSVSDPGGTGAVISGDIFTAAAPGPALVTASVKDGLRPGLPFTKEFTVNVRDFSFICEIVETGVQYPDLQMALDAIGNGESKTIRILDDILHEDGITIRNKTVTFDLNGFGVELDTDDFYALVVLEGGNMYLAGEGEFNVTGKYFSIDQNGGEVSVTNVKGGDVNVRNGKLTVIHDLVGGLGLDGGGTVTAGGDVCGRLTCADPGSGITVAGSVIGAVLSGNSGRVNIGGDVTAASYEYEGVVHARQGGVITVAGKIIDSYGACAVHAADRNSSVTVGGVRSAFETGDPYDSPGIRAEASARVFVLGDCDIQDRDPVTGAGILAESRAEVTVDGVYTTDAPYYIYMYSYFDWELDPPYVVVAFKPGDYITPTSKTGYLTYAEVPSTSEGGVVWINADPVKPVVTLTGITVTSPPDKTEYTVGETLELAGLAVQGQYSNGSVKDVTALAVTDPAGGGLLDTAGIITVTVSYTEGDITKAADFAVTVREPVLTLLGIKVTRLPDRLFYFQDELLDLSGMVVTAYLSDGSEADVTAFCRTDPAARVALREPGTVTVTVSFTEADLTKTDDFSIEVAVPVVLESIEVTTPPNKLVYWQGDSLDLAGLVVMATYSDGSKKTVTEYSTNPAGGAVLTVLGARTVAVSYSEGGVTKTADFKVDVIDDPVELESIAVTRKPDKSAYIQGEALDLSGMTVMAAYTNGDLKDVTNAVVTLPVDGDILADTGVKFVDISYTEGGITKGAFLTVTVSAGVVLSGIEVTVPPDKTWYESGEELDLTGMTVTAFYSDRSVKDITNLVTTNPTDGTELDNVGAQTVVASYTEGGLTKTANTGVTVEAGPEAPGIAGPDSMSLTMGYKALRTTAYTITGTEPVIVSLASDYNEITWNDTRKTIDIAAGLAVGEYTVTLTASNGIAPDAAAVFTFNVVEPPAYRLSGEITIGARKWHILNTSADFSLFYKSGRTATVIAADIDGSREGVTVDYYLSAASLTLEQLNALDDSLWQSYSEAGISLVPRNKYIVYVRLTGAVAGPKYINSGGVVIYSDSEAVTDEIIYQLDSGLDKSAEVKLNDNTISRITCVPKQPEGAAAIVLAAGTDYTVTAETITFSASCLDGLEAGDYTLTVFYNPLGMRYFDQVEGNDAPATTEIDLTVLPAQTDAVLERIGVTTLPDKKYYVTGEALDLEGMIVTAYYSDGSDADVTALVTADPVNGTLLLITGGQTVTVSYTEGGIEEDGIIVGGITKTDSFTVNVSTHVHIWDGGVITTPATCEDDGVMTYTCTVCDEKRTEPIPALGHDWDGGVVTTAATCETDGVKTYTCERCGETYTEPIPATGHDWDGGIVTAPTCTEQGYTTYTCRTCGKTDIRDYTEALGHDWDGGVVTTAATCETDGVKTYTCERCGETYTEPIPALGHDWDDGTVTAPTCTEQGYTTYTCRVCGETDIRGYTEALGHDWDGGVVTLEPTEEDEGEMTYTCLRCGATRIAVIPPKSHNHNYTGVITPPTCTEQGYTVYSCECGDEYTGDYVAALGHSWDDGTVTEPTCTEQGYTTYICLICQETKVGDYTFASHIEGPGVVTKEPTRSAAGERTYYCTVCGEVLRTEIIPATGQSGSTSGNNTKKPDEIIPKEEETPQTVFTASHIAYLTGYPDGSAAPDKFITRAEICAMLFRLLEDENKNTAAKAGFSDLKQGAWYYQMVAYLAGIGVVTGYPDGTFRPDAYITRAEFVTIIARFFELAPGGNSKFSDIAGHWAQDSIIAVENKGWITGNPDGTFGPQNNLTRAQAVTLINRMLNRGIEAGDLPDWAKGFNDLPAAHWAYPDVMEASTGHLFERKENDKEIWTSTLPD